MLASDCIVEAQALLNDQEGLVHSSADLLPYLKKAYRELQTKMFSNQIATVSEVVKNLKVTANSKALDTVPTDLLYPINLAERLFGTTGYFTPMTERSWEPDEQASESLRYWVWREEQLQFIGATTDREVQLQYVKTLSQIVDGNSTIPVGDALSFLAARTAALGALFIGENPSRASLCQDDANAALSEFIGTRVRRTQTQPARHRRNRYRR